MAGICLGRNRELDAGRGPFGNETPGRSARGYADVAFRGSFAGRRIQSKLQKESSASVDGYAVKVVTMSPILLDYYGNFARLVFLRPTVLRDRVTAAQH